MWINILLVTYSVLAIQSHGLNFIELPGFNSDNEQSGVDKTETETDQGAERRSFGSESDVNRRQETEDEERKHDGDGKRQYPPVRSSTMGELRRYWLISNTPPSTQIPPTKDMNDKDAILKSKIHTLILQTLKDTEEHVETITNLKARHRDSAPYKIGFILSLVKKSRDVLNELFNLAVKHRDETKALEQLKVFELIVHTNVDTTNYVRQLVEIHIQNLNSTHKNHENENGEEKRRVVLL